MAINLNQILSVIFNLYSWIFSFIRIEKNKKATCSSCIEINGPGGLDRLRIKELDEDTYTVGYNVRKYKCPYATIKDKSSIDSNHVLLQVHYFSINYADISIRFGLYESALRFVGWPIVPGFDIAGVVTHAGKNSGFEVGDEVFGFSLFGSYSSKLLVPSNQIRKLKPMAGLSLPLESLASLPAVAATALHAIALGGGFPNKTQTINKACLIHSAAGGVGSMLIQMCSLLGYYPIVGVVGSSSKINYCRSIGATHIIDKSKENLWQACEIIAPYGFNVVFDANGVSTLKNSFDHLAQCGRLIVYGFHTNLPLSSDYLSPLNWLNIIFKMGKMPKFDPMELVTSNKSVLGFNLSFLSEESELINSYMNQIVEWVESGSLKPSKITLFEMDDIQKSHSLIQSGKSIGKIVIKTPSLKAKAE